MRAARAIAVIAVAAAAGAIAAGPAPAAHRAKAPPPVIKPRIVWDPIPFGAERKAQMRAYAERHYGIHTYKLIDPHVIVLHYTDSPDFSSTYNTFAADVPDPELHELPADCAHYVIDGDGTIHQLVSIDIMCRHTVGLNWTAIGIEHVGLQRRPGARRPSPAEREPQAGAVAALPLSHRDRKRDRPRRELVEPVPPRARGGAAHPDPR